MGNLTASSTKILMSSTGLKTKSRYLKGSHSFATNFIHADFTFAYRGDDRNWEGLFTSSDFEKPKFLYKVPLSEIVKILELAVVDYPRNVSWRYDPQKEDWIVTKK